MTTALTTHNERGFTLIETMVALAMFLVICGAIFKLLNSSQQRFQTDSQVLNSFQDARLGLDQIVRDADDAGYPPFSNFSALPAGCNANQPCPEYVESPIAWRPGYFAQTPCVIGTAGGGTCITPGDFDVIFEENPTGAPNGVEWIRYTLQGTTLFRGTATKVNGSAAGTLNIANGTMLPYITNVMNNASPAQIAKFQATYPSMFPGGNPQPVFQYYCPNPAAPPALVLCQNAGASNAPSNVVDVEVTLIVQTPQVDAQTRAPRLVELNGRAHRINPNQ
jgi:prepilin-type N-terminal cleavage/methylation domain-containing protein